jgi:hypothetical protein
MLAYRETAGLTLDEVIDSNGMSQMNEFRGLGHSCIPGDYIMKFNGMIRPHVMMK